MNPALPAVRALTALALTLAVVPATVAAGWTHYRGPNHDGVYTGSIRTNWAAQPPRLLWRIPMGAALSSLSIEGGRAYTQARRTVGGNEREFAVGLDAATGKELWAVDLDLADYPNGGVGDDDGPRSTPVIDGDRVYVFTSYLRLFCLDAATGREIWRRDFRAELGANVIAWQNASSPLVIGDLVLVNANTGPDRLTAVRKSDGVTVWRDHDDRMTQASPVYASIAGIPQVVFFTQTGLVSVRPENGSELWRFAFPYSTSTGASPVVADDIVYCSAAYTMGSGAVRLESSGNGVRATELWKQRNANMNHWATPVHHEGHLYGVFGQSTMSLRCVIAATGEEKWRLSAVANSSIGEGSILKIGGNNLLLVQTDSGTVALGAPSPTSFQTLASFQGARGKCWNTPALHDGILYARSTTEIAAFDIAPPRPAAPLQFSGPPAVSQGRTLLRLGTADGSTPDAARLAKIRLLSSDDPARPLATWTQEDAQPFVDGNEIQFSAPFRDAEAQRFFQLREQP